MTLREWLQDGAFSLSLSSGFFGFFAHGGFLSVLEEERLVPERVTGCSAGALASLLWAGGMSAEEMLGFFTEVKKSDFWDPALGLGLLRGQKFRNLITEHSRVPNLEDSPIPVAVSALNLLTRQIEVFDSGPVAGPVYASCAIPPLFQPIRMAGSWFCDGAFGDRPGLQGIPDGQRVLYHHLNSRKERKNSRAPVSGDHVERLASLAMVRISDLPAVSPDRLEQGPQAFATARDGFRVALDWPADLLLD